MKQFFPDFFAQTNFPKDKPTLNCRTAIVLIVLLYHYEKKIFSTKKLWKSDHSFKNNG